MTYANVPPKITDATITISYAADGVTASGAYWGYCTRYDVLYEFPQHASMTNIDIASPTAQNPHPIGQEITNAAFELQGLIDHLYVMPYTGNDAVILATLRELNAKMATSRLIKRYFQGSEPNLSMHAAERDTWVAAVIEDLRTGILIWYAPFGDATAQPRAPIYDLSLGATIYPNPSIADQNAATPIFTVGRTPFKSDMM